MLFYAARNYTAATDQSDSVLHSTEMQIYRINIFVRKNDCPHEVNALKI